MTTYDEELDRLDADEADTEIEAAAILDAEAALLPTRSRVSGLYGPPKIGGPKGLPVPLGPAPV
jgi:hypothetical protein